MNYREILRSTTCCIQTTAKQVFHKIFFCLYTCHQLLVQHESSGTLQN